MDKYLILLAGPPSTGKSYLLDEIQEQVKGIFSITPDDAKEIFAESYGFDNLSEKQLLEIKVWEFYYQILELYMEAGKRVIASEYPFSDKQKRKLQQLSEKFNYKVITIRLIADFDILWERRYLRDRKNDRHLSHIMSHYHLGDELENRLLADNHITYEDFKKICDDRGYNDFVLGELYEFDVSDYAKVDYTELIDHLGYLINK